MGIVASAGLSIMTERIIGSIDNDIDGLKLRIRIVDQESMMSKGDHLASKVRVFMEICTHAKSTRSS